MMGSPWREVGEWPELSYVLTEQSGCCFEYKVEGGQDILLSPTQTVNAATTAQSNDVCTLCEPHRESNQEATANNPEKECWELGEGWWLWGQKYQPERH